MSDYGLRTRGCGRHVYIYKRKSMPKECASGGAGTHALLEDAKTRNIKVSGGEIIRNMNNNSSR